MACNTDFDLSSTDDSSEDDVFPAVDLKEREIDREEAEQALLNAVRLAETNLKKFKAQAKLEQDLDRAHRRLMKKKTAMEKESKTVRKPVLAPAPNEVCKPPPIVKGAKKVPVDKEPDELFAASAKKVAHVVMQAMVNMGVTDGPVIDGLTDEDSGNLPIALPLTHEEELEFICFPEQLRHDGFTTVDMSFPALDGDDEATAENMPVSLNKIFRALASINGKVEHLVRMQQLHTVSHIAQIRAHNLLRQLCVADGIQKTAVYKKLQLAMKSVLLASDPDFADLPFRNLQVLEAFFTGSRARVTKFAHFLLVYVEYNKDYCFNLLSTVLSVDLIKMSYWKCGTANNG